MKFVSIVVLALTLGLGAVHLAANDATEAKKEAETKQAEDKKPNHPAILKDLWKSYVIVEYTLQYHEGVAPQIGFRSQLQGSIEQERPSETLGVMISDSEVLSVDPMVHSRFIKSIAVRHGDTRVDARVAAYGLSQKAVYLKLDKPLKAKPLTFDGKADGPYYTVKAELTDEWMLGLEATAQKIYVGRKTQKGIKQFPVGLVVDKAGQPVGAGFNGWVWKDEWKGSPKMWERLTFNAYQKQLDKLKQLTDSGIVRVQVSLRSPRASAGQRGGYGYGQPESNERHEYGVVFDQNRVLVLANYDADTTARIERMRIFPAEGKPITASFVGSLKDYAALIVKSEKPLTPLKLDFTASVEHAGKLLYNADVRFYGELRDAFFGHARINAYSLGWKRMVFPRVERDARFLFNADLELVALPLARRPKVAANNGYGGYYRERGEAMPVAHLEAIINNPKKHFDPNNTPLGEDQENRVAWLGVELQAMKPELARINKVSRYTQDGQTGAIVTYVYPKSPAANAGIEAGDILLRIYAEDQPAPIAIQVQEFGYGDSQFPWDRYDELPEQFYDRVPTPWTSVKSPINSLVTRIGFGKKIELEYFTNNKVHKADMKVVESPAYYANANRHKDEHLGLTVRDMTFEVRRYFRRKPTDTGVIISKIEPGSRASRGGLKPYEFITEVNGVEIKNVQDFEKAIQKGDELRLSVVRQYRGRVAKIKQDPSERKPAKNRALQPADKAATQPAATQPAR